MTPNFWQHFSPENRSIFSQLSVPRLAVDNPPGSSAARQLLRSAGLHSLNDLTARREETLPLELGIINDDGIYDPFRGD